MDDSLALLLNMPDPRENEDERDSSDSPVAEILPSLPRYRSSLGLRTGPEHAGAHAKGLCLFSLLDLSLTNSPQEMTHWITSKDMLKMQEAKKWVHLLEFGGFSWMNASDLTRI